MILDHFSYTFGNGQTTCLTGPSGCGKTTLLRLASGLLPPDRGVVEGNRVRLSFVFQEDRLLPWFSALENITCIGVSESEAAKWLAALGLKDEIASPVGSQSGGMQRRIALARALAFEADAFFLDEPFRGLDAETARKAALAMKPALEGKTVIFITHHPLEAFGIADRFVVLSGLPLQIEREAEKGQIDTLERWTGTSGTLKG